MEIFLPSGSHLLLWLEQSAFRTSVLILIILVLRLALRRKISSQWRHMFWLLVVVQMILPWSPASIFSVDNLWNSLQRAINDKNGTIVVVEAGNTEVADKKPPYFTVKEMKDSVGKTIHKIEELSTDIKVNIKNTSNSSNRKNYPFLFRSNMNVPLIILLWGLVAVVLAVRMIFVCRVITTALKRLPLVTDEKLMLMLEQCKGRLNIHFPIGIVSAPDVSTPMIVGFLRPVIVFPENVLRNFTMEEIRNILLHELSHVKRQDIVLNWLMAVLQCIQWFNPLVWVAFKLMRADREEVCDAMAIKCLGYQENVQYGETIIKLLAGFGNNNVRLLPDIAGIIEEKDQIKMRIYMIKLLGENTRQSTILAATAFLCLAAAALTSAKAELPNDVKHGGLANATTTSEVGQGKSSWSTEYKNGKLFFKFIQMDHINPVAFFSCFAEAPNEKDPRFDCHIKLATSKPLEPLTFAYTDISLEGILQKIADQNKLRLTKNSEKDFILTDMYPASAPETVKQTQVQNNGGIDIKILRSTKNTFAEINVNEVPVSILLIQLAKLLEAPNTSFDQKLFLGDDVFDEPSKNEGTIIKLNKNAPSQYRQKISLSLKDANLKTVLQEISNKAGLKLTENAAVSPTEFTLSVN